MEAKRVNGLLLFSLLALAVCNNMKAAEAKKAKIAVQAKTHNNIVEKKAKLIEELLKTKRQLEDCQDTHTNIVDKLQLTCTEPQKYLAYPENKFNRLVDQMGDKLLELHSELAIIRPLARSYRVMETFYISQHDILQQKLTLLEKKVLTTTEGNKSNVDFSQKRAQIIQLKQDNSYLSKEYRSLQLKHKLLKSEYQKLSTKIKEQD